jgi:hypothetical protein
MDNFPYDPDAERDLVGAVILYGSAFERADLKASDFYVHRWRWFWEACEAIRAEEDEIDLDTLNRALVKAGRLQDVTGGNPLWFNMITTTHHVEANARRVREMAERRRMLARDTELAQRAVNLEIPLPLPPKPVRTHWTMAELAAEQFPEPEGPFPGLIPNGLTLLGGRPKRGKSWLMLQAGCSLALGGKFLERDLQQGKVLYYALEDRGKRLQDRTQKLGIAASAQIEFETALPPLHLGGLAALEQAVSQAGHALVVIDTIRRALPGKDFNKDGALFDDVLSRLQTLAQQKCIAIVAVLHTRKTTGGFDPDPVDDVLGSTGLTASADMVLALYTEQGRKGATLKGRGRDLDDVDLALTFDPITCAWQSLGDSTNAKSKELENEITSVLEELGKATIATISKTISRDFSNSRRKLISMWTDGKVKKEEIEGKLYYFLPARQTESKGSCDQ